MKYVADLHLHSRYSRACSRDLELPNIQAACLQKGIDIIGSADFTHPAWFGNLHNQLAEDGSSGLYYLKAAPTKVRWLLSTELSLVYKDKGKTRRIHLVVHAPNLQAVKELNDFLDGKYNIRSDGRPILGIKAPVGHACTHSPQATQLLSPMGSPRSNTMALCSPRKAYPMTSLTCSSRQARTQRLH